MEGADAMNEHHFPSTHEPIQTDDYYFISDGVFGVLRTMIQYGMTVDGAHHKQWVFEQIWERFSLGDMPEHEKGVAP